MRVLLANDDGVHAPGIHALFEELGPLHDTIMIAPLEERSTTGHSLSLDKPLRLEKIQDRIYGCSGFPADCVLMGLGHVMKEHRPDVVVSGINRGANLGQDLYYSGTIAAAREAAFHNVSAIAVSLVLNNVMEEQHYKTAAKIIKMCLEEKLHESCPPLNLLNINVPNLDFKEIRGLKLSETGFRKYSEEIHVRIDARNREYFWIAGHYLGFDANPDSDCQSVGEGFVSITPHALIDRSRGDYNKLAQCIERINGKIAL